jgi:hypothetical protein
MHLTPPNAKKFWSLLLLKFKEPGVSFKKINHKVLWQSAKQTTRPVELMALTISSIPKWEYLGKLKI